MRATSGKSLFTETLYVAQIIRYVIVYGIVELDVKRSGSPTLRRRGVPASGLRACRNRLQGALLQGYLRGSFCSDAVGCRN